MSEYKFDRIVQRYPEFYHFKLSKKSIGRKETGLKNHDFKDARLTSFQIQEKQHPILNLYSKSKQLNSKRERTVTSQRSTRENSRQGLGHDLEQLTKGNQHELDLSPHPSLTIMVQPNKIDYSQRSIEPLLFAQRFVNVITLCFSTA